MKNKIKKIIKKHCVLHENGTYWRPEFLNENIENMYEELSALYDSLKKT